MNVKSLQILFSTLVVFTMLGLTSPTARADFLVSSFSTNSILNYDSTTGAFLGTFASGGGLTNPEGLAYGPDGNLYVASSSGSILRYNGSTGAFMNAFVTGVPSPQGRVGLAFGPDGNLYVSTANEVLVYDGKNGGSTPIKVLPLPQGNGTLFGQGMTFGPDGRLYVALDAGGVLVYNNTLGSFQTFASAPSSDFSAFDLAFGPDGNLYVSDFNDVISGHSYGLVLRYSGTTGALIDTFVDTFGSDVDLDRSSGLAFGPNGNLYVGGFNSSNVQEFSGTTGEFQNTFVPAGADGLNNPTYMDFQPEVTPVPAPSSLTLFGVGLLFLLAYGWLARERRSIGWLARILS